MRPNEAGKATKTSVTHYPFISTSRPPKPSRGFVWSISLFWISTKKLSETWFLQARLCFFREIHFVMSSCIDHIWIPKAFICQDMGISRSTPMSTHDLGSTFRRTQDLIFHYISKKENLKGENNLLALNI